ncbi:hypothetical protein OESDEN_03882 [Oesophagostomum dentatum]|uniref:Animal hem peroxidase n=1 Tax=Oesophagostomum dentatum TaxID=61180 RepID=A0A0B1TJB8_OESDE|nr:hypothetical protein OESDEN_03882 [Oesophagostomum dentatum]
MELADFRKWCDLPPVESFADLYGEMPPSAVDALESVYDSAEDIDLFTGIISERPLPGAVVGPTAGCIIAEQFSRIKKCDRFHYENDGPQSLFLYCLDQLQEIRKTTLSSVICANRKWIKEVPPDAFSILDDFG